MSSMESLIYQIEVSKLTKSINLYIDLSDMHSTELSKYIKCSGSYVKKLNLSKNRISDEGMNVIIKAICES